ncbi:ankyrin repeat domain-containing protein [Candidatus Babela massiliensis]|uniref:Ankyrin repeats containing protein n=1 Tax=Candidatus Babela massiliensis TaxID=673862 RepID=V6DF06_9BACT|nr:ankyrin repeat domain-containing protein [Candidatus Babela massiliensis]CDK30182.1 Ankyrin repeats containing protein [Candidatus Babela massiliensis]
MNKTSRFKFLLSILILVDITLPLFSMEEDSHKRKREEEQQEVIRNIRSRIELSDLPLEVRLHIINQGILSIIKHNAQQENGIFDPLKEVKEFISSVSLINREYNSFKNEFLKNARKLAKQVFAPEFSNNSQEEQVNLDNELKAILEGEYNQENEIKAAKLIIAGASPNVMIEIKTSTGIYQVPIILAISFIGKFKNLIDLLARYKANFNYQLKNGNTALINSIILGYDDISKMLIDNGADVNIKNKEGNTALMLAIIRNRLDIVKELIFHGADVNARGLENNTALMLAITFERIPIIYTLIDHGAEINVANDEGLTPREIANQLKLDSIVELIDSKVEK